MLPGMKQPVARRMVERSDTQSRRRVTKLACPHDRRSSHFTAGCDFFFERPRTFSKVMGFARAQPILRAVDTISRFPTLRGATRRSNPVVLLHPDCFASLAMTMSGNQPVGWVERSDTHHVVATTSVSRSASRTSPHRHCLPTGRSRRSCPRVDAAGQQGREADRAARLDHQLQFAKNKSDRGSDFGVRGGDALGEQPAVDREVSSPGIDAISASQMVRPSARCGLRFPARSERA